MPAETKGYAGVESYRPRGGGGIGPGAKALLDDVAREGARRMLIAALEAERDEYVESLKHIRDERTHALVVKNGYARPRDGAAVDQ